MPQGNRYAPTHAGASSVSTCTIQSRTYQEGGLHVSSVVNTGIVQYKPFHVSNYCGPIADITFYRLEVVLQLHQGARSPPYRIMSPIQRTSCGGDLWSSLPSLLGGPPCCPTAECEVHSSCAFEAWTTVCPSTAHRSQRLVAG